MPTRTETLAKIERPDAGLLDDARQVFPDVYSMVEGVFTFRGNPQRTGGATGVIPRAPSKLEIAWQVPTSRSAGPWYGGTGWTGQAAIVKWPTVVRHSMASLGPRRFGAEDFVEVIQGSLDGQVHFLDLMTGRRTRQPIDTKNPIKGSVSLDPRGYPLLFVGQGIPEGAPIGLRVFELLTSKEIFFLPGRDAQAPRKGWGAFDSSGLLNRLTDTYVVGGENGLVYLLRLNTVFDPLAPSLKLTPQVLRYRYRTGTGAFGVENSLSAMRNLAYFADNGGQIQAVDLRSFTPIWGFAAGDDTDASLTLEREGDRPVLYTGCEVDRTGPKGFTHLRKLDGFTGAVLWDRKLPCLGATGPPKKIDAGMFATNAVGRGEVDHLVYFTLSRCPGPTNGTVYALDKRTGAEVWKVELGNYSWVSPTLLVDEDGKHWLLQGEIGGVVRLFDALTGRQVASVKLAGDIESSPAVFGEWVVWGTRADRIYGLRIRGAE